MDARPLLFTLWSIGLWALLLVVSRIVLVRYDIDPWSFAFVQLLIGGVVLVAVAGGGEAVDWRSLRRPATWAYGALRVTTASAFTAALVHTTVAYAGMLGTVSVPLAVIGAGVLFGRRPSRREIGGHVVILIGIGLLIGLRLEGGLGNPAVVLMLISELAVVGSSLIAETHPDNNAESPQVRRRFTGTVLLITAAAFLVGRVAQRGALDVADDLGPALWISGLVVGAALRGPAMHASLRAIRLVGADVYLMLAASLAFTGLVLELGSGALGMIERPAIGPVDLLLVAVIAAGSLWVFRTRQAVAAVAGPSVD
ncbi:MAG: EamA family transporter [Actinomycetota bacterium]